MALTVSFGNGGTASSTTLFDADTKTGGLATNGGTVATDDTKRGEVFPDSVPESVDVAPQPTAINVPGGGTGSGGTVALDFLGGAFNFDVVGAWNSVKNAEAKLVKADANDTLHGEKVSFSDFVHVDVDFSNAELVLGKNGPIAGSADSSVSIENVKRVNVLTGLGNDTIDISLSSNSNDWQNIANVKSGSGDDTITLRSGAVTISDNPADKASTNKILDGRYTTSTIDGGDGVDHIDLSGLKLLKSTITGGLGNDTMTGNLNSDTYVFGAANSGNDTITNFQITGGANVRDHLDLGGGDITNVDYHAATNSTVVTLSNGGQITFENLSASKVDLLG